MTTDTDAQALAEWLLQRVVDDARGTGIDHLETSPAGRHWLGKLATEEGQLRMAMGDRGERLDPCAMGIRIQPGGSAPWAIEVQISFALWSGREDSWTKIGPRSIEATVTVTDGGVFLAKELDALLEEMSGSHLLSAELRAEMVPGLDRPGLELVMVNTSPESLSGSELDSHFYEVELAVRVADSEPFVLAALPDSFRYDRQVPAYGINAGVESSENGWLRTTDALSAEQTRPSFWNAAVPPPDLTFETLALDPIPQLEGLVSAHGEWGATAWGDEVLSERSSLESWTSEMWEAAQQGRLEFAAEHQRLREGVAALSADSDLLSAFKFMNTALIHSSRGRYGGWRPFQIGFVLAITPAVADPTGEADFADIVWFATGGGKTETYLGLVTMAALYDRITGKSSGVTAWSRFPLRLLSLQQTQRFADAIAGAELVRRQNDLGGDPFSMGFLIGNSSTPNRIPLEKQNEWDPDPEDDEMPGQYRVLLECPFCFGSDIEMAFDHLHWTLDHRCKNDGCPWAENGLPFHVVDDEIYRFLPTVIVGTLDKIASVSIQASMAGLFGPPRAVCSEAGHGHTYAPRSARPRGCLVPGCDRPTSPLPMAAARYGPTFRLQDELHLLRDALGAVDAHYEALIDHLQWETTGTRAKILGSSATLSGYEHQVEVLYRRAGRVFPAQGPSASAGFWTSASVDMARTHVALAPRGSTLEFANDRIVTVLQSSIRELAAEPDRVAQEVGVAAECVPDLVSLFGTNVVYGNTIRDLDAAARSLETQVPVEGRLNTASLTGQTPFDEVREVLDRLQDPEPAFEERVHVVTASSMMSHGVDVDRLNTMVVLGLPLTTAEYIQTTARVGRRWPGLVFVLHKMARERDASTHRAWRQFVSQGDRFVEAIPITGRSTRVLSQTMPGLFQGRLLHIHEPRTSIALTTVKNLRKFAGRFSFDADAETQAIIEMLGVTDELSIPVREEIQRWIEEYFDTMEEPPAEARFPSDLSPGGNQPMLSLRDVEEQAPLIESMRHGGGR